MRHQVFIRQIFHLYGLIAQRTLFILLLLLSMFIMYCTLINLDDEMIDLDFMIWSVFAVLETSIEYT